jgi:hypothetical protein
MVREWFDRLCVFFTLLFLCGALTWHAMHARVKQVLTYAHLCSPMLTYAHLCSPMLTYAASGC